MEFANVTSFPFANNGIMAPLSHLIAWTFYTIGYSLYTGYLFTLTATLVEVNLLATLIELRSRIQPGPGINPEGRFRRKV